MEVYFSDKTTESAVMTAKAGDRKWGAATAAVIRRRWAELKSAEDLAMVAKLPQLKLRKLPGNPTARFAIPIPPSHQIVFEVAKEPGKGGKPISDPYLAVAIRILSVEETDGN